MTDRVYVPEKESNPDPPERCGTFAERCGTSAERCGTSAERSDNAQRIRLTAEMRRKMFQLQVGMLIDRQVRKRYDPPSRLMIAVQVLIVGLFVVFGVALFLLVQLAMRS